MSKSVSSPNKGSKKGKEREALAFKLKSINDRLHKVHEQRKQMSPLAKYSIASKAPQSMASSKRKKRMLYHPKLDLIIAENCYSPYLTKPTTPYSEKTIHVPLQVKELRFCGSDVNAEGFPVKMEKAKEIFMKDIIEYKAHFEFHEERTNLPMQYIDPPPEFFIPDVHAKPRERSMVYPNTYQPLKGHTGKLPTLVTYLRHDPNSPKTTPTLLKRASSVEDCEKMLEELESQRPGTAPGSEPAILRQSSGTLKAHAGRGGPEKYRQEVRFRKAVKELKRMISTGSFDEEDGDGQGLFFAENDPYDVDEIFKTIDHGNTSGGKVRAGSAGSDAKPETRSDDHAEGKPEWDFGLAVIRISQITCVDLKCDSVFGKKSVYAALKYGKLWSAKTRIVPNAPDPVDLLPSTFSKSMAFQVTPEAMSAMRLSVTVFNTNEDRPDCIYGMCKLELSELLRKDLCKSSLSREIVSKAGANGGKIIVTFDIMSKEEYDALPVLIDEHSHDKRISAAADTPRSEQNPKKTAKKKATKSMSCNGFNATKASNSSDPQPERKATALSKSTCDDVDDEQTVTKSGLLKKSKPDIGENYEDDAYGEDFESTISDNACGQTTAQLDMTRDGEDVESSFVCVGGDLEHSCDDDYINKSGTASGQDLHEKSVFYDLSVEDEDCFEDVEGLSTGSMILGDSGLLGLGVEMPAGEESKSKHDRAAVLEENATVISDQANGPPGSYEDDFIYDDEDDDGSLVSGVLK